MAFPASLSQVPVKHLTILVTEVSEKNVVDPQNVLLALARLKGSKGSFDTSLRSYWCLEVGMFILGFFRFNLVNNQ